MCPWHHCDICGRPSTKLCNECPNSFCAADISGNIFDIGDNRLVCADHDDILDVVKATLPGGPDQELPEPANPELPSHFFESSSSYASSCASSIVSESSAMSDAESHISQESDVSQSIKVPTLLNVLQKKVNAQNDGAKSDSESSTTGSVTGSSRRRSRTTSEQELPNGDVSSKPRRPKSPQKRRKSASAASDTGPNSGSDSGRSSRSGKAALDKELTLTPQQPSTSPELSTDEDDCGLVIDI